jgi:ABC-type uncharacterized transport system ATPase subunit
MAKEENYFRSIEPEESSYKDYAVVMKDIVKQFPSVLANDHVNLYVKKGEIHAVVGENGAGKSTLMNQLYGMHIPTSGKIFINGKHVKIHDPNDAIKNGIGMVHQHFMLVPPMTVTENMIIGVEPLTKAKTLDIKRAKREIEELSRRYSLTIDPDAVIEDLSVGMQQRVEILKALYRGAEILILDEPSAVLTPQEVGELFEVMRSLKSQGKTIIFITHKLHEVIEITDNVTVMQRGKVTGRVPTKSTDTRELARMMVGRDVVLRIEKTPPKIGGVEFEVKDLVVKDNRGLIAVNKLSLSVRKGEILGIAGVAGNGQTELGEAITGLRKPESGKVILSGKDVTGFNSKKLREAGLSHIPEDRLKHGLVSQYPVFYNMILGMHTKPPFAEGVFLNYNEIRGYSSKLIEEFDVRPPQNDILAGNLSGGNQQKVILAREFSENPKFMLVSQPTRGLDVGAIEFIHKRIIELRDKGVSVLLISMELEEIFSLSDRIAVMYEGNIMGIVKPDEVSFEDVGLMMAGTRWSELKETRK